MSIQLLCPVHQVGRIIGQVSLLRRTPPTCILVRLYKILRHRTVRQAKMCGLRYAQSMLQS